MRLNLNLNHSNTAGTETATIIYFVKDFYAKFRSRELKLPVRDFPAKLRCWENNRDRKKSETRD